jgi:hypothetical protein
MKAPIVVAAMSIMLASDLVAQGVAAGGAFNPGRWNRPGIGINPGGWNRPGGLFPGGGLQSGAFWGNPFGFGNFLGGSFFGQGFPFVGMTPWVFPAFSGERAYLGDGFDLYQPPPPAAVAAPAPQERPAPPAPPQPAPRPVVTQYNWAEASPPQTQFSVVGTDGVEHQATSVWVQGDRVYFTSPDGGARQMPLSSVSRRRTQAANARKNLTLPCLQGVAVAD